jgi:two-component system response regulator AtoC
MLKNKKGIMDNKSAQKRLLVIDDEENMRHMLISLLGKSGYLVDTASDGYEGLQMIDRNQYDFILCDIKMPRIDGMEFLRSACDKIADTIVIMMSAYGTIDIAVEAMKLGAYDYISKPFKTDEIYLALKKAEERESLKRENFQLKERIQRIKENYNFGNMVAKSRVMQSIFSLSAKVAKYDTTVLIYGASGTGKELVARGIHFSGNRSKNAFVPVNCGGIPENLLESELFGYKKGAFTGAVKDKIGLFEEASGGTIFLDEIGEMPLSLQVKLLRVLQENEIRPVGDSKPKKVDVRPPLRERNEDIPLLCNHFINQFNNRLNKDIIGIAPAAMSLLLKHNWPGNVRELENIIERAIVLAEDKLLAPENFPSLIGERKGTDQIDKIFEGYSLKDAQRDLEKMLIRKALTKTQGNRTKASQLLEISHPSLLSKIKAYNILI